MRIAYTILLILCLAVPAAANIMVTALVSRYLGGNWTAGVYLAVPAIVTGIQAVRHKVRWWFIALLVGVVYAFLVWPTVLVGAWMMLVERPRLARLRDLHHRS
jgi:hypothetical protein